MSAMNDQIQLAINSFDQPLIPGSVKKLMSGIKALYEGQADAENPTVPQIKGAGGSSDLWKVPVNELKVLPGFNVRLPGPSLDAHIAQLTSSILEEGYFQHKPLAALVLEVDGVLGLYIFDGHCRLDSTKKAIVLGSTIEMLPVVVQDGRYTDLDELFVSMYLSSKGKELAPIEVGILCKRMYKNGHDHSVIAKRMGIKATYVDGLLRLVSAPKALFDAVVSDELAASEAIKMLRALGNGSVVKELEDRRARALAEANQKAPVATNEVPVFDVNGKPLPQEPVTAPARPRITARHASDAHVKTTVRKHGLALFQTARTLKADPAYSSLAPDTRQMLEALLVQLDEAEKADALPAQKGDDAGQTNIQTAA